ncbi:MAG: formate dehydrogenase accessory sulfurtransferase FdhD [Halioglobus sp.]
MPLDNGVTSVSRLSWEEGSATSDFDQVVEECPVAMVYNGVSHVVMMATPADLEDFALGFGLTEQILATPEQLLDIEVQRQPQGIELQMTVVNEAFVALKQRRRNLVGRTGCGLCGAESLAQAIPDPVSVSSDAVFNLAALENAVSAMLVHQPLKQLTGSVHGAAFCDAQGKVVLLREDVGRHNALDKLIGAMHKEATDEGFILVTSRASYEMVAKTARAGVSLLAAVSAPTSLAIEQANLAGITLVGHVRQGRQVIYTHPERVRGQS